MPSVAGSASSSVRSAFRLLLARISHPPLAALLAVCALILAARRPDMLRNPQFWAEDSIIFYQEALLSGASTLIQPYAGYFHLIPRVVAALSTTFDPAWAPAFFVFIAALLTLYVAARTQSSRCPLPRHAGTALAVVLVPDAFEVLLTIVNVQWILAGGFLLLLVSSDPQRPRQWLHDVVATFILGLTGPFSVVFSPLFIARAWLRRTRASITLAALVLACAAGQTWFLVHAPPIPQTGPVVPEALLAVPGMRVAGSLFVGKFVPLDYPRPIEIALGLLTLAAIALLALRRGPARPERIALGAAFVVLLASTLYRCRFVLPDLCHIGFGARYFFPIQLVALWLLLAAAADDRRWLSRTAAALLLGSLALNVPRLREPPFEDLRWRDHAAAIREGRAVEIPVHPQPWKMVLPARQP